RGRNAPLKEESIQQQQDHGTDDRHDPTGHVIPARKDAAEPSADKGDGDAKQNRDDATAGIFSRHQQFCDRTNDETDKQGPNNRMSAEVHSETELYRVESRPARKLIWMAGKARCPVRDIAAAMSLPYS